MNLKVEIVCGLDPRVKNDRKNTKGLFGSYGLNVLVVTLVSKLQTDGLKGGLKPLVH